MRLKHPVKLLLTALLTVFAAHAQPQNDDCSSAIDLCPNTSLSGTNTGATASTCPTCEDLFNFCFSGINTVWYRFTTNPTGGDVSVDFSNLVFNLQAGRGTLLQAAIIQAAVDCNATTFSLVGNCEAGTSANFSLTATALPPNTTYYVVVNGAKNNAASLPAEATFDIDATGTGVDRLPTSSSIGGPGMPVCPETMAYFTFYMQNCQDSSQVTWRVNGTLAAITATNDWQVSDLQDGDIVTAECTCFTACKDTLRGSYGPVLLDTIYVDAGPDQTINPGNAATLSGASNGDSTWWTPAVTVSSPYSLHSYAYPTETTTYFLTAQTPNCTLSDEAVITVMSDLSIPGSFSPNGDGYNDSWVIKGIDTYPNAQMQIFDRWGQEMTVISGYSSIKSWDGTNKGKPVTDGTYYYVLDLFDGIHKDPIKGYVMVIR